MRDDRRRLAAAVAVGVALVAGAACAGDDDGDDRAGQRATTTTTAPAPATEPPPPPRALSVEVVATGLDVPWSVAFLPDGRAFVGERGTGLVKLVDADGSVVEVARLAVAAEGEGGLLGLAVSPSFVDDGLLYAYLTTGGDNRIVRFRPGEDPEPVLTGIPAGTNHDGGRIAFGPDGLLYAGTGDAGEPARAQDLGSLGGKILRLTPDGGVPEDNPIPGSVVYSYGHRNVQGLAWDADGRLVATEYGPDVDDEVNLVEPGGNHGWPVVTGRAGRDAFVDPIAVFEPGQASPAGAVVPTGSEAGDWAGDLVFAALRGQRLWRLDLGAEDVQASATTALEGEYGRLRDVAQAPDGSLWVLTSNRDPRGDPGPEDDRILRVLPPVTG